MIFIDLVLFILLTKFLLLTAHYVVSIDSWILVDSKMHCLVKIFDYVNCQTADSVVSILDMMNFLRWRKNILVKLAVEDFINNKFKSFFKIFSCRFNLTSCISHNVVIVNLWCSNCCVFSFTLSKSCYVSFFLDFEKFMVWLMLFLL